MSDKKDADNFCPLCNGETQMNSYEYHPDMTGPKPYDIACKNKECGHTYMPHNVESHITSFEMLRYKTKCEALEEKLRVAVEALEYIESDMCVIDNKDGHKEARQALSKIKGGSDEPG